MGLNLFLSFALDLFPSLLHFLEKVFLSLLFEFLVIFNFLLDNLLRLFHMLLVLLVHFLSLLLHFSYENFDLLGLLGFLIPVTPLSKLHHSLKQIICFFIIRLRTFQIGKIMFHL